MYEYTAKIGRVVDGDTIDLEWVDLGFSTFVHNMRIRINGIDAAEARTSNLTEKSWGIAAMNHLIEVFAGVETVRLKTFKDKTGKYGRMLGTIWVNDVNINDALLEQHFAIPYDGGNRSDNRTKYEINEFWDIDYDQYLIEFQIPG